MSSVLEAIGFDNFPMFIEVEHSEDLFKFDMRWINHPNLIELIKANWIEDGNQGGLDEFVHNLNSLREILSKWSKREFGNGRKVLQRLMDKVK